MKKVSLSGSLRGNVGKKDAKAARAAGKVPCVIYGGKEQVHISLDEADFKPILFTPESFLIEISVDGKTYKTILKDVQYHPVGDNVLHADFYEVTAGRPVVVSLPVKLTGVSPGVLAGGKLRLKLRKVTAKGLLEAIPEEIVISINKLKIGQSVKVRDLSIEGLEFVSPASAVIVDVKTARGAGAMAAEDEEEAAEDGEAAEEAKPEAAE